MKKLLLSIIALLITGYTFAASIPADSLEKQLAGTTSDSLKALLNTRLALSYMNYGGIQNNELKTAYQENALKYTLAAIHNYSRMDDSTGLRTCYERLAKVYFDQKKYSQAKWFILQANTMAREQRDVPTIVSSLVTLAHIKMAIKDYYLAKGDLQEALTLSSANCFAGQQADVMFGYVQYYKGTHKPFLSTKALKRYAYMKDSMKRDSQMSQLAKIHKPKKYYLVSNRVYKRSSRTISL